jgi:hypothetical protein
MANRLLHVLNNGKPSFVNSENEVLSLDQVLLQTQSPTDPAHAVSKRYLEKQLNNYPLIQNGKISASVLPALSITDTFVVSSENEMLALTAQRGDVAIRTDLSRTFILKGAGGPYFESSTFAFSGEPYEFETELAGKYIQFYDTTGAMYYVWFQFGGVGSDPALPVSAGSAVVDVDLPSLDALYSNIAYAINNILHCPVTATGNVTFLTLLQDLGGYVKDAVGTQGGSHNLVVTNNMEGREVTQISGFTPPASLDGKYWTFYQGPLAPWYVWYNFDGSSTDPQPMGFPVGVMVNITNSDTLDVLASKTAAALQAEFTTSQLLVYYIPSEEQLKIALPNHSKVPDASAETSPLIVQVINQGAGFDSAADLSQWEELQTPTDIIVQTISEGDTTHVPSSDAVYQALEFKEDKAVSFKEVTNDNASPITAGQVVYMKPTGSVDLAIADDIATCGDGVFFVVDSEIASGASGLVAIKPGHLIEGFTGLVPGSFYYVSAAAAGSIVQVPDVTSVGNVLKQVGLAIAAEALIYLPAQSIEVLS